MDCTNFHVTYKAHIHSNEALESHIEENSSAAHKYHNFQKEKTTLWMTKNTMLVFLTLYFTFREIVAQKEYFRSYLWLLVYNRAKRCDQINHATCLFAALSLYYIV